MSDTGEWFAEWATFYVGAIGHTDRTRAVLMAAKHHLVFELRATLAELGEVLTRQLAGARVPAFPAEVTNALVTDLRALREERAAQTRPDHSEEYYAGPRCPFCGITGLVTVPHPRCVWQGRIVCYPGTRRVVTVAVLCDAPDCARGREVRDREAKRDRPRLTLTRYFALPQFGGLDALHLLHEHEREQAAACRRRGGPGQAEFEALLAAIRKNARDAA